MKTLSMGVLTVLVLALSGCSKQSKIERHLARAEAYSSAGAYDAALLECRTVLSLDRNNVGALKTGSHVWLARGDPLRALAYVAAARDAAPTDLTVQRDLLRVTLWLGKFAEVREQAQQILRRLPDDEDALLALVRACRTADDLKVLETAAKAADRNRGAYWVALATLQQRRGDAAGAVTTSRRGLKVAAKNPPVHAALAALLLATQQTDEAKQEFKAAADLAGDRSDERLQYAEILARTAPAEAAAYLTDLSKKAPDFIPAWRGLAEIAIVQKNFEAADNYLKSAYKISPANFDCDLTRAKLAMAKRDAKGAIAILEEVGRKSPGTAADKYQLALAYLQAQDPLKALSAARSAVVQNPDHDAAVLLLAELELRVGSPESALAMVSNLVAVRPDLGAAQVLLLEGLRRLGKLEAVLPGIQQQIEKTPERPELYRLLGLIYKYQGNLSAARQAMERSLQLAPGFPPMVAELVELDLRERKFDAATLRVKALQGQVPDAAFLHVLDAEIAAARGDWEAAQAEVVSALERDASYAPAYRIMRVILGHEADPARIAQRLETFLAQRRSDFGALMFAGEVHISLRDFVKARDAYEKALSLQPDATLALNNLAFVYSEELREPARALTLATRARQLDPNNPDIADTLGLVLYRHNDHAAAMELLQESTAKQPANAQFQYHLGLCGQAVGNNDVARRAFAAAVNSQLRFAEKDDARRRLEALGGPLPIAESPPADRPVLPVQ